MVKDVKDKILQDFGTEADKAINLIEIAESKLDLAPRVSRCIIHLANGDISKLKKYIKDAKKDWRDVILWAETNEFEFNKPFKVR